MKRTRTIIIFIAMLVAGVFLAPTAFAQDLWAGIDFSELEAKADEIVDITLNASMLQLAAAFLSDTGDEAEVRALISGLEGIYVKSFSFDEDWAYDKSVAERIRSRIPPGFERIVSVRSRKSENVEIYARPLGQEVDGLIIIASEPDELTFVNLVGRIDIAQLGRLDGQFGIPDLDIDTK